MCIGDRWDAVRHCSVNDLPLPGLAGGMQRRKHAERQLECAAAEITDQIHGGRRTLCGAGGVQGA